MADKEIITSLREENDFLKQVSNDYENLRYWKRTKKVLFYGLETNEILPDNYRYKIKSVAKNWHVFRKFTIKSS
jgi:hypothetical protein